MEANMVVHVLTLTYMLNTEFPWKQTWRTCVDTDLHADHRVPMEANMAAHVSTLTYMLNTEFPWKQTW